MQISTSSNDFSTFGTTVTVDLFNRQMVFDIASLTEFTNSPAGSGCQVAFGVKDQSGVWITGVDWTTDFASIFDDPQIPDCATETSYALDLYGHYAFLFQQYRVYAAIMDNDGNIYQLQFPVKTVCKPDNFTDNGYVYGLFDVRVDCTNQLLTVTELTNLTYNLLEPTTVTKDGTLYYPRGTVSDLSFSQTPFTDNRVYTGTYTVNCTTTATYDLSDGFYVEVMYVTDNVDFPARCGTMMAQVMCCVHELYKKWQKNCDNAIGKQAKDLALQIIIPLIEGQTREQRGLDASAQVAEIQKILDCDCDCNGVKKVEASPVNPLIYNIVIDGGGDVVVNPVVVGNTKTYTVISKTYTVGKKDTSDLGWSITVDTSIANTVIYKLKFNYDVIANYILTEIQNSDSLLILFNSLVWATGIDLSNLNGSCIIDLSSINYFLTYRVPSAAVTVVNIIIGSTTYTPPSTLLVSNTTGIETWLNGLGLGTFQVDFASTNGAFYSSILTNNNANSPVSVTYQTASGNVTVTFTKTNKSLVAVLQALINYLCEVTSLQVYLGQSLSLCSFDYNEAIITTTFNETDTVGAYQAAQAAVICDLVTRINDLTGITCDKLKTIFADNTSGVFGSNDRIYGTLGGNCAGMTASQAAIAIYNATKADSTVKELFCSIDCSTPATCPDISAINFAAISTTIIGIYGVTWTPANPTASQTVTVKYRVTGTSSWITATTALNILPNGNVSGTSPYQITGLSAGVQYDVFISNNCGGVGFINQITLPSGTIYTADYLLDTILYNICGETPTTLYSSTPFATGVILYTDLGLTTPITGYDYVSPVATGIVYDLDNATGEVGSTTGLTCGGGIAVTVILGSDTGTICAGSTDTRYVVSTFDVGETLYVDSALSTPVTGNIYVVDTATNIIYNLDTSTGVIGASTGLLCGTATVRITSSVAGVNVTNVTGIAGFTPSPAFPMTAGDEVTGTHTAFTGAINVVLTGTPVLSPTNVSLYRDGTLLQCRSLVSPGTVSFLPFTYGATQVIRISLGIGSC